jgi:hypothetical protein
LYYIPRASWWGVLAAQVIKNQLFLVGYQLRRGRTATPHPWFNLKINEMTGEEFRRLPPIDQEALVARVYNMLPDVHNGNGYRFSLAIRIYKLLSDLGTEIEIQSLWDLFDVVIDDHKRRVGY